MRGKGIYRRGKVWWICYAGTDKKMRYESSHSSNFRVAETLLTDRRKSVDEGKEPVPKPIKDVTLAELAPQYLSWAERQKAISGKRNAVKLLVEKFGNLPLRHFSGKVIEQYQTELLREGRRTVTVNTLLVGTKTAATVNRYVATLKHMIRKAVDWEMLDEGTLLRVRKAKALQENNRRLRYLSGDEAKVLIQACSDHLKPIIITALNTGCRKEEILSLEWDKHIDLRHGFILLDITKNGERRQIPISPMLRFTLQGIVRRVGVPYVFCCKKKTTGEDEKKIEWTRIRDIKTGFHAACRRS
jgi:integrase